VEIIRVSWFRIPNKEEVEIEERKIKRGYGKVKRISDDVEPSPFDDAEKITMDENKTTDTNIDQVVDYSDDDD
jgi:hypothetical protein